MHAFSQCPINYAETTKWTLGLHWQARRTANPCPCFPVVDVSILPPQRMPYCFASEEGGAGEDSAIQSVIQPLGICAHATTQHGPDPM